MFNSIYSLFLLFGLSAATCSHATHLQRRSEEPAFGYGPSNGPLMWDRLSENNTMCREGRHQSPIDIGSDVRPVNRSISIDYDRRMAGTFENLGTTMEVTPSSGANQNFSITLGGTQYDLRQFHLHTPSEHHLNGEYFPLELHLVHESADDNLLVLGILFNVRGTPRSNTFLPLLSAFTPQLRENGASVELSNIDMSGLMDSVDPTSIFTYSGSLTTPPCSEDVTWLVHQVPLDIDSRSLQSFKRVIRYNARNIQSPPGQEDVLQSACSS